MTHDDAKTYAEKMNADAPEGVKYTVEQNPPEKASTKYGGFYVRRNATHEKTDPATQAHIGKTSSLDSSQTELDVSGEKTRDLQVEGPPKSKAE